ncbi:MAG: sigma 54-interacting transcriptional regulator [Acidobacteriota bacterium]
MTPRLVAISGPCQGQTFEITGSRFVIGRKTDCDLRLDFIEISRRHCEIVRDAGRGFTLRDLGSRHGTLVNGKLVNGAPVNEVALNHSDLVTLGTHALLFLLDDSAPPRRGVDDTGSLPVPSLSLERRLTESLHLDPSRVDAALPAQARLARELHALLRLSTALQEQREVAPLAARLLDVTLEALPTAERGAVLLREPGLEQPIVLAERGDGISETGGAMIAHLLERVLGQGLAVCSPQVDTDPALGPAVASSGIGSLVAAPLAGDDGQALGLIYLDRRTPGFAEHHLELLTAIAGVASLAFRNVLHLRWLERENRRLRDADAARHDMIGESAAMRAVLALVARVARADSTVLIQGESGTGKELVAHAIHRSSPRREGPFIAINCATLSDNLLESELFGHEKGAFTGALARKPGKMEAAHRGTLFLDEVAEIPVTLQAKLLRALQEREIERVGGTRPIPIDVRVVAATHRQLEDAVAAGDFRQDLYYRLKVITLTLPPLRDRRDDIPLLARHFARRHGEKLGSTHLGIAPEARRCLLAYDWPGNVRELGNAIERAVVLGDGEVVRREDLPDEVAGAGGDAAATSDAGVDTDFQSALVAFKKQLILDAWQASGEDYARTAERLGIHLNSLHRMVKNLGIKDALGR